MLPKHEYGENVANNDDQGLEYGSKYNCNDSCIVHNSSFELALYLTESFSSVLPRFQSSACSVWPVFKVASHCHPSGIISCDVARPAVLQMYSVLELVELVQ